MSGDNWSFTRWVRESRAYMSHMPWWKFYPLVVWKWPGFNRVQKADAAVLADLAGPGNGDTGEPV